MCSCGWTPKSGDKAPGRNLAKHRVACQRLDLRVVRAMMNDGASQADIAVRLGVGVSILRKALTSAGLSPGGGTRPLAARLKERLIRVPGGCLIWTGTTTTYGYGKIGAGGRGGPVLATHRVAWELAHGPIPDGVWVLHRCDNPPCCDPAHLFLGDSDANIADMVAKHRHRPQGRTPLRIGERQRRLERRVAKANA